MWNSTGPFRVVQYVALLAFLIACCGCGGTPSGPPPPVNVTVAVSPSTATVSTGTTQQFSATVAGTSNSGVTWSVNDVAGGNNTFGMISTTGLYTAPATIPSTSTLTVKAASVTDPTKTASAAVTLTGTIETATQTVAAASGGMISLPSGSSVSIPPGALASDQSITASLLTNMTAQPPGGFIMGVGPALVVSGSGSPFSTLSGNIQFVINPGTNVNGLQGSAAMADLVDSTGDSFFGVAGSFDSTVHLSTITIPADLMNGTNNVVASMANLAPAYTGPSNTAIKRIQRSLATVPPSPGQKSWNGSAWVPYSGCPPSGSKTLVLVHGMKSSLDSAYGGSVTALDGSTDSCVNQIKKYGKYDQVVGFDYDWASDIATQSGPSFASFLNTLAACGNQIDVEAHSEGGPVAAYGITQAQSQTQSLINNFVGLGNPWNGTAAANNLVSARGYVPLHTILLNLSSSSIKFLPTTLLGLLNGPYATQLQPPASSTTPGLLNSIQQNLGSKAPQLRMILACGTRPGIFTTNRLVSVVGGLLGTSNDGVIPLASCQATGPAGNVFTGLKPQLLVPYSLGHTQLTCDPHVIADVGSAVTGSGLSQTFTGTFSGSFGSVSSDVCTWSVSLSGALNMTLTENPNGTLTGQATAPTSIGIVVTSGANCTSSPFSVTATGPVTGNDLLFGGTFTDGAAFNMVFTGSRSGGTVNGSVTVTETLHVTNSDGSVTPVNVSSSIPTITLTQQ